MSGHIKLYHWLYQNMQQWQYWNEISLSLLIDFLLFFSVFINIHQYANYANMITCIFDHRIIDLCLSFHLVQILVIYG